jgi:hypothetical protein
MHIHGAQLNPNLSSSQSEAALAARRAGSTRRKLTNVTFEIEPLAGPESGWVTQMAQARPDSLPGDKSSDPSANPPGTKNAAAAAEAQNSPAEAAPTPRPPDAAVSFWA